MNSNNDMAEGSDPEFNGFSEPKPETDLLAPMSLARSQERYYDAFPIRAIAGQLL